jgi:phospholipid transport system substrate-binding protein
MSDFLHTRWIQKATLLLLFGVLTLSLGLPAQAQTDKAALRAMLEQRDKEIKTAIKPLLANPKSATTAQRNKVEAFINDGIDFKEMGSRALGPFWKDLSTAQRTEFVDVFSAIVRAQSLADLDIYNSKVTYQTITVDGKTATVKTLTDYKNKQTNVTYLLTWHDNAWWIYDIVLDGVSTIDGYARSFQSVIRKRGYEALKTSLDKKKAKVEAKQGS